jgi:hypothetical protein
MKLMAQLLTLWPYSSFLLPLGNVSAFARGGGDFSKKTRAARKKRNNLGNVGFAEVVGWKVD